MLHITGRSVNVDVVVGREVLKMLKLFPFTHAYLVFESGSNKSQTTFCCSIYHPSLRDRDETSLQTQCEDYLVEIVTRLKELTDNHEATVAHSELVQQLLKLCDLAGGLEQLQQIVAQWMDEQAKRNGCASGGSGAVSLRHELLRNVQRKPST